MVELSATVLSDDKPPRADKKSTSKDDLKRPKVGRSTRKPDLTPALLQIYVAIGAGLAAFPATQADAATIFANAESAAKSVAKLADEKPEVYKALQKMIGVSAYGGVIAAHLPIIIGIAANHGLSIPNIMPSADDESESAA